MLSKLSKKPKRIALIRTFKLLKGGGPVPPLGLLYLASAIRKRFGDTYEVKIIDTGLTSAKDVPALLRDYAPTLVGLSAMSCEDDLMREMAKAAKDIDEHTTVLVGGAHSLVAKQKLLDDENIDIVVLGEAEETIVELIEALESGSDLAAVRGIAFRSNGEKILNASRSLITNIDDLPFPAWDLVDMRAYAEFPNWNGALKGKFYATLTSSRGCPYGCFFCHNVFGKSVRARTPENVFKEIKRLHNEYGVREIHILDDIFNVDEKRASEICRMVIDSGMKLSFAFPNGLRADILTDELIYLLRKAGTYKVNFGFETTSPRLQKFIGKNLNIPKAVEMIGKTAKSGIIAGAYFMLGFPTQTREEIMDTINFAAASQLDLAYFFKATPYPGSEFFKTVVQDDDGAPESFSQYHFYSVDRSYGELDAGELNGLILLAQQKFYMHLGRLWRGFIKSPHKGAYLRSLLEVMAIIIQAYLFKALISGQQRSAK